MNKQVEQIKAEIERLYNENKERNSIEGISASNQLRKVLSFIDSLQEDSKFKVGDIIEIPTDGFRVTVCQEFDDRYICDSDGIMIVVGKDNQDQWELVEEPVSEELEEEDSFDELLQELYIKYNKEVHLEKLLDIATNFVKWQKQQMMKNVTFGEVVQCATYPYNLRIQSIKTIDKNLKVGDKVKLLIIKEE